VTLEDWLNKIIFPMEEHLTPEAVYCLTKVAILEYLKGGITASSEMYYFPCMIAKAAGDMHFPLHLVIGATDYKGYIDNIEKINSPLVTYNLGVHSVYTIGEEDITSRQEYFKEHPSRMFSHIAETKTEVSNCKAAHKGMTPLQYLDSLGLFKDGGAIYHANYLEDIDYKIIKEKGIIPVTCAGSNAKLASGVCPVRKLLDMDIPVAIGTDGPASNDSLDMFYEMKLVASLQKISSGDPTAIKPIELVKMATVNGALAMGLNDSLYIAEGQKASLIEIDLTNPAMQPVNNIVNNLMLSGSKDCVKMTICNGRILYRDNKFYIDEDIDAVYKSAQEYSDELKKFINI
ncbi:MAG: amidohydrolase family protein, partial [Coprobacillus sp.]|nr:amidohydrolase family protein [Coprobacillus sp.]